MSVIARYDSELARSHVAVSFVSFFFFFQAEDGIRDTSVTGVQTCALPIFARIFRDSGVQRSTSNFRAGAPWHLGTAPGARLCPKDQPQHPRMPSRGETSSMCRSRQSLRLVLRTQPRCFPTLFGGSVEMRPRPFAALRHALSPSS